MTFQNMNKMSHDIFRIKKGEPRFLFESQTHLRYTSEPRLLISFCSLLSLSHDPTANPRIEILDFRGFESSRISILGVGIPRPIGKFPESLSQQILVWRFLVWGLAVSGLVYPSAAGVRGVKALACEQKKAVRRTTYNS